MSWRNVNRPPQGASLLPAGGGGQDQGDNDMSLTENSPGAAAGLTPFLFGSSGTYQSVLAFSGFRRPLYRTIFS